MGKSLVTEVKSELMKVWNQFNSDEKGAIIGSTVALLPLVIAHRRAAHKGQYDKATYLAVLWLGVSINSRNRWNDIQEKKKATR